ncbi:hypothetical protein QBC34DRAFT_443598 [Podospora aff. communis PSN243]|uniref:Cullin family profile domain-containing protein n=1 Tax=Podospora aff. communis PSN243 TaxID=3040156 RepID=A0AAV9G2K1_9PEZI|nr:hypothetical protein QBC34DRAFT_443598 [Podospora aff. communis PSN243]
MAHPLGQGPDMTIARPGYIEILDSWWNDVRDALNLAAKVTATSSYRHGTPLPALARSFLKMNTSKALQRYTNVIIYLKSQANSSVPVEERRTFVGDTSTALEIRFKHWLRGHLGAVATDMASIPAGSLLEEYGRRWCDFERLALFCDRRLSELDAKDASVLCGLPKNIIRRLCIRAWYSHVFKGIEQDLKNTMVRWLKSLHSLGPELRQLELQDDGKVSSFRRVLDSIDRMADMVSLLFRSGDSNPPSFVHSTLHKNKIIDPWKEAFLETYSSQKPKRLFVDVELKDFEQRTIELALHLQSQQDMTARLFNHDMLMTRPKITQINQDTAKKIGVDLFKITKHIDQSTSVKTFCAIHTIFVAMEVDSTRFVAFFKTFLFRKASKAVKSAISGTPAVVDPLAYVTALAPVVKWAKRFVETTKPQTGRAKSQPINHEMCHAVAESAVFRAVNKNAICGDGANAAQLLFQASDAILSSATRLDEPVKESLDDMLLIYGYLQNKERFLEYFTKSHIRRMIQSPHPYGTPTDKYVVEKLLAEGISPNTDALRETLSPVFPGLVFCQRRYDTGDCDGGEYDEEGPKGECCDRVAEFLPLSQSSSWALPPAPPPFDFIPPLDFTDVEAIFETRYTDMYKGRKLSSAWHLSHGEVEMSLGAGSPSLRFRLTVYQMAILLLFNEADVLCFDEIRVKTGLLAPMLEPLLEKFVDVGVLQRRGEEAMVFSVNEDFRGEGVIDLRILPEVTSCGDEEIEKRIKDGQNLEIQAAIVRVMKSLRKATIPELTAKVVEQLQSRFSPTSDEIVKCLDQLVEKDYVERGDGDSIEYVP